LGSVTMAPAAGAIVTLPKWAPDSHQFVIRAQRRAGGSQDAPIWTNALFLVNAGSGAARRFGPDFAVEGYLRDPYQAPEAHI